MGKKKKQLVGYRYFIGMHHVIAHSVDALLRIDVGEKPVYFGPVTTSQPIIVFSPELFGGDLKEGGVAGKIDVMMGESTQAKNPYLFAKIGPIIPAFRGVFSMVLNQVYCCAMSPYPKPWRYLVKRISGKTWYPAKAEINGGANASHIIYDCFTNSDWGMGYSESSLHLPSFVAAADTLFAEGLGLSFLLSSTDSVEAFIKEVARHANGVVYTRATDAKFVFKLLRDDYVVNDLPLFNESNIISLDNYETPALGEIVNEVVCKFRPQGTADDDSVTVQDLASIQSQEGIVSQEVSFPGIDNQANAGRIAMRELRTRSTPLIRVRFKCNRQGWDVTIGSCIRFSWAGHRIANLVLRVTAVNFGNLEASEIIVDAIQDVFGLPFSSYLAPMPSGWVDPVQPPNILTERFIEEATYWFVRRTSTDAEAAALTAASSFMIATAAQPAQATPSFELWTKPAGGAYAVADSYGVYAPVGTTAAPATRLQTTIALPTTRGDLTTVPTGTYAKWDNELIRFDAWNPTTNVATIARGVLDTVPAIHSSGSKIYFNESSNAQDERQYASGETANAKLLMRTGSALYPLSGAPEDSITFVGRYNRPYPPGNFKLNALDYPTTLADPLTVSWSHRDRTQQLGTIIGTTVGNIGPEAGVTYNVRVYNDLTSALYFEQNGITGTSVTPSMPSGAYSIRVELESVRGGVVSFQKYSYVLLFSKPSDTRIIESGDDRITEDGDTRIIE